MFRNRVASIACDLFFCALDEFSQALKIKSHFKKKLICLWVFFQAWYLFIYLFCFSLIHLHKWFKRKADTLLPLPSPVGAILKVYSDFNEFCGSKLDTEPELKAFTSEKRIGLY